MRNWLVILMSCVVIAVSKERGERPCCWSIHGCNPGEPARIESQHPGEMGASENRRWVGNWEPLQRFGNYGGMRKRLAS